MQWKILFNLFIRCEFNSKVVKRMTHAISYFSENNLLQVVRCLLFRIRIINLWNETKTNYLTYCLDCIHINHLPILAQSISFFYLLRTLLIFKLNSD